MISFRIPIVILLKSKPENTNHSYDKCVNEYTMNSLLPIPIAFSMLLKMSSCKKRSELYRTCILSFLSSNAVIVFFDAVIVQKRNRTM